MTGSRSSGGDGLGCHPSPSAMGQVSVEGPEMCSGRLVTRAPSPAPARRVHAITSRPLTCLLPVISFRILQTSQAGLSKIKLAKVMNQLNV